MERVKRGQIFWADLGEPRGSETGFRRPVLVVQDDLLTASRLGTVMVVPLTTNLDRAKALGNVLLPASETGLPKPSVALVCQVLAVDKSSFEEPVAHLSRRAMEAINAGLRLALDLD